MADVFHFQAKRGKTAARNRKEFIRRCRDDLSVFGKDLDWTSWWWPKAAHFTHLGTLPGAACESDALDGRFVDFAKAYFRYQQGHTPTGTKNELKALRCIERALIQQTGSACPSGVSARVLDEAATIARAHYSPGAAYHAGREIQRFAEFLTKNDLSGEDIGMWKSSISRKCDDYILTGKKAQERHAKKLPASEALDAMAEIFANKPTSPRDIFTSSLFAMSLCAPSRVSELLGLSFDCEHTEHDSKGRLRYGWRFHSGKGYGADIKWIPTEMVSIASEAVGRILELTQPARQLASWIEDGNNRFFRHDRCPNVGPDRPLSPDQVAAAIGLSVQRKHAQTSLRAFGLDAKNGAYTLDRLWKEVIERNAKLPPLYDERRDLKYSNALFCMTRNLLHQTSSNIPVILWRPTSNTLNNDLNPRRPATKLGQSIFIRYGYTANDGSPLKLTSHQARHLLDTIAQRGGLSQSSIAKWAGRASTAQNRVYNHLDEFEMVAKVERLGGSEKLFGPLEHVSEHSPITVEEAARIEHGAVHVTEFGVCVHDYTMSPCEKYRDCLNCEEQICVKGDDEHLERMKRRLEDIEQQLIKSEAAMVDGSAGADRWYEHHRVTQKRLSELIEILENPSLENGSLVRLENQNGFSTMRRAIATITPSQSDVSGGVVTQRTKMIGADRGKTSHKAGR